MPRSPLERKLVMGVLVLFVVPTLVAVGILVALHERGVFEDPRALGLAAGLGLTTLMAYLAFVAHAIGRSFVRTVQDIQRGTELMATVHPEHRHRVDTGDELEDLAAEVNRLADCLRDARRGLEAEVERATRALQADRAMLATVLGELDEGVVAIDPNGRIWLMNRAARALLRGHAGLGDNLLDFFEREGRAHIVAGLRKGPGQAGPLVLDVGRGLELLVSASPLGDAGGQVTGFVLGLRGAGRPLVSGRDIVPATGPAMTVGPPTGEGNLHYDFSVIEQAPRQGITAAPGRPLDDLTFVVFDVETTGLDADGGDRIVSLAGVRVRGGVVRRDETFETLVNPGRPVPASSSRLHGITDAMLRGAPGVDAVLPGFERFARDAVLVGHEVWFDLRFLALDAQRIGAPPITIDHPILDTRRLSGVAFGARSGRTLEEIADRLGVSIDGRHTALGDALATAEILVRLLPLLRRRGLTTLEQVQAAQFRYKTTTYGT